MQPASRPDVDGIYGIPPTVAIEQRTSRGGRKSTVATLTEIYHFLRLLYQKLGVQYCPKDGTTIEPQSFDAIVARLMRQYRDRHIGLLAPLIVARKGIYTDLAKWAKGKGFPHLRVDGQFLPTDKFPRIDRYIEHNIELPVSDLVVRADREAATARGAGAGAGLRQGHRDGDRRRHAAARRASSARCRPPSSRPGAPATTAAPAIRSSIRGCSPSTPSTAGAPPAWAPASRSSAASTPTS